MSTERRHLYTLHLEIITSSAAVKIPSVDTCKKHCFFSVSAVSLFCFLIYFHLDPHTLSLYIVIFIISKYGVSYFPALLIFIFVYSVYYLFSLIKKQRSLVSLSPHIFRLICLLSSPISSDISFISYFLNLSPTPVYLSQSGRCCHHNS